MWHGRGVNLSSVFFYWKWKGGGRDPLVSTFNPTVSPWNLPVPTFNPPVSPWNPPVPTFNPTVSRWNPLVSTLKPLVSRTVNPTRCTHDAPFRFKNSQNVPRMETSWPISYPIIFSLARKLAFMPASLPVTSADVIL